MSFATDRRARWTARIVARGELLTVTRDATSSGGSTSTQSLYFISEALETSEAGQYFPEGALNVGEGDPRRFIVAGDADVAEKTDVVTLGSFGYRLYNVHPGERILGVTTVQFAYGVRQ